MLREAKSLRYLSMTTFRGGLPGMGTKGSMTCGINRREAYLGVDVGDAFSFLAVEAHVDLRISEIIFAEDLALLVNESLCLTTLLNLGEFVRRGALLLPSDPLGVRARLGLPRARGIFCLVFAWMTLS